MIVAAVMTVMLTPLHAAECRPAGQPDRLQVTAQEGRLSVRTAAVPLTEVLRAIAEAAGLRLIVKGELGSVRPQAFSSLSVAEALRRLVGDDHALLMIYHPHLDGTRTLAEVRVYGDAWLQDRTADVAVASPRGHRRPIEADTPVAKYLYGAGDAERQALKQLGADPDDAGRALSAALDDPEPGIRLRALRALQALDGEDVLDHLTAVARRDPDPGLRQAAIYMLGGFTSGEVRRTLQAALADPDEQVRQAAEQTLSQLRAR